MHCRGRFRPSCELPLRESPLRAASLRQNISSARYFDRFRALYGEILCSTEGRPDEARELTSDRDLRLVRGLARVDELPVTPVKPKMRAVGHGLGLLGLPLAPLLEAAPDFGWVPEVMRSLNEKISCGRRGRRT